MRKYFTRRCIGLHLLMVVLVPTFLAAGWWQYHVALGGNDLSWVYTVEWPFFAVYAVYVWWKMIHDQTTMLDRLWAVKARAAADAEGKPLHQIPGWAMDKALSQEVIRASLEAARLHELGRAESDALGAGERVMELGIRPGGRPAPPPELAQMSAPVEAPQDAPLDAGVEPAAHDESVIDARVLDDKVVSDDELDAYNRYLADLSWRDPPKVWRTQRGHRRRPPAADDEPRAAGSLVDARQTPPGAPAELENPEVRSES